MICKARSRYYTAYFDQWLKVRNSPPFVLPHVYEMRVTVRNDTTVRCTWCGARRKGS